MAPRKLASVVAVVLMVLSATVLALGLGDINTRSALNQAFDADIELLSVDPAELDTVRVRLASAEAFQRAGIDRPFYLSDLKFTAQLDANGKPVIHVHSERSIREPYLNFLLEVNWPKGKLLREYTVLLDPPTTLQRRPAPVARPQSTARPAPVAAPAPAPAPAATRAAVMPDQYGPVKNSETLWGISRQLRPDGASLAQTMIALYKANPDAFVRGDINRLQRGRILRVPGRDEVFALSRREAQAAYAAEQEAALASRTQPPATTAPTTRTESEAGAASTGGEEAAAELRIATPRPEGKGEAGAGDDTAPQKTAEDLNDALLLAREDAETARQSADNLRGEVDDLEKQLKDMQRVISLQNEQLARLQATIGQQPATPADDTGSMAATPEPAAAETAPGEETPAEAPPAEMTEPEAAANEPPAAPTEPAPVVEAPETEPRAMPAKGLSQLLADNVLLVGAAAVVVLLLLLLLLRRRGNKDDQAPAARPQPQPEPEAEEDMLEESILQEEGAEGAAKLSPEDAAPPGSDTSFLSEFSASEMHSLADETSEVDPVSEADVYIAYGRYDQAEELLGQALNREPQRMALKFKLLEVYYANRNVAAFTACAQELADAGQDGVDTDAWQRVCEMGRELAPDYPLFSAVAGNAGEAASDDSESSQQAAIEPLSDFGAESILEIPSPEQEARDKAAEAASEHVPETEMDLTLDLDDLSMPQSVSQDEESLEGLESIELELPDLDVDPGKKTTASDVSDDSLILELDTGMEDSVADDQEAAPAEELDAESLQAQLDELSDLTELDDELSRLSAEFDGLAESKSGPAAEEAAEEPASEEVSDLEIPAPFAGQMGDEDEVQTKLDLAIAYVEMGDRDGARSILDEVRAEGSEEQKAQAEKLLGEMDA